MRQLSSRFTPNHTPCGQTRREFLWQVGGGFAGLALIDLMTRDRFLANWAAAAGAATTTGDANYLLAPKPSHFPARAKRAVFLFMNGGPSQVDTFDPKPELKRFDGTAYTPAAGVQVGSNGRPIGHLMASPFEFRKHG